MTNHASPKGILKWGLRASLMLDAVLCLSLGVKLWDVGPRGFWLWLIGLQIAPKTSSADGTFTFTPAPHYGFTFLIVGTLVGALALTVILRRLNIAKATREERAHR